MQIPAFFDVQSSKIIRNRRREKLFLYSLNGILTMVTFSKKLLISLMSSFLVLTPAVKVYAKSDIQSLRLKEIDSHIDNRDYNEALKMLSDFIRDNPTQFDEAQKRINRIMETRENLTTLAEELIYVIEHDPENDELKLELIDKIENIEVNPSPQMKAFLESTRRAAEFAVNRIKFQSIISQGAELTHQSRIVDAVLSQIPGFDVYYDAFVRDNDAQFVSQIDEKITAVKNALAGFEKANTELEEAFSLLRKSLESDAETGALQAMKRVQKAAEEFVKIRNIVAATGYTFQDLFAIQAEEQGLETEASYLPFVWRFLLGTSSETDSGMLGAMDVQWNRLIESVKPAALTAALLHFDALVPLTASGDTSTVVKNGRAAEVQLKSVQSYLSIAGDLNALYGLRQTDSDSMEKPSDVIYDLTVSDMFNVCTWIQGLIINDELFQSAVAEVNSRPFEQNLASAGTAVSAGDVFWVKLITANIERLGDLNSAAVEFCVGIMNIQTRLQEMNGQVSSASFMNQTLSLGVQLQQETDDFSKLLISRLGQYTDTAAREISDMQTAAYEACFALLNDELDPEVSSYPQKVIPEANRLLPLFTRDISGLTGLRTATAGFVDESNVDDALNLLSSLIDKTGAVKNLAQDRIMQANRIFAEGELRYSEAQKAISRDDYTSARSSIQKAGSKYAESFLYREDESLRAACDAKLIALGEEINRLENERIVLEVRRLKNQAKTEYYAGNFELADSLLQQAKARWLITNVEDDPETVQLLALVGTALSIKTGRTLSPSAPLYPEMSQTLNIAHSFYAEGEALLKKGQREAGIAALEMAQQKIRELQLVYPLNQDASLMSLQINKLIDPAAFETYFAQKVAAAKEEYKDKTKQRQVYADLLDLYEINPSYKGLKDFIYTVEIELGVRQKPIDRTAQNQSDALYKEAVALYNKNTRDEINLRSALVKVDEALAKNPDNEAAQTLKDRINIALGGSGSVVLPSEAESMYQKAVQELQKGNTIQAAAIVMQLMQNPEYAKSAKILDLKKKVDSLL